MKNLIITALLAVGLACAAQAQTIDNIKLADLKADYIELREVRRSFSNKIFVSLEYGQKVDFTTNTIIKDDSNNDLEYNSALDCVNKMKQYDYELFQVYLNVDSIKIYVLKKK